MRILGTLLLGSAVALGTISILDGPIAEATVPGAGAGSPAALEAPPATAHALDVGLPEACCGSGSCGGK